MNFKEIFKQGKAGRNIGLTTGIPGLDQSINGIQRKSTYSIAAAPKCGKTTLCDYAFVLMPYLEAVKNGTLDNVHWIYFSYEIDRISKEFKFAAFFMYHDFDVAQITYKGKVYEMSQDYLMGKLLHKNEDGSLELIPVTEEHEEMLKHIYTDRIIPIFGEYDDLGKQIKKGIMTFIEDPENPTGLYKGLMRYAEAHGNFIKENYTTKDDSGRDITLQRIVGYRPTNPDLFTIIVTDHIRKLKRERGFSMKENIDKWLEYSTWLRNICGFTFVHIVHMNRGLSNVERLKYAGEFVYPTGDDVKDSGNISEESTVLLSMFKPQDEKYNLKVHFGADLTQSPNYRSIHVADSRYTECPVHIQTNMYGGINVFTPLKQF